MNFLAVDMLTGCYCSVTSPSLLTFCHCLSFTISPRCSLFVISLIFFYSTFLLVTCVFFFPYLSSPLQHSWFCFPLRLTFLLWIPPEKSRNRAGLQLDEQGHTDPADLVMPSHHKASLSVSHSVSLSHVHVKYVQSNLTQHTLLTLSCNSGVKGFHRTVMKTVPTLSDHSSTLNHIQAKTTLVLMGWIPCKQTFNWPELASS